MNYLNQYTAQKAVMECVAHGADNKPALRILDIAEGGTVPKITIDQLNNATNFWEFLAQFVGDDGSGNKVIRVAFDASIAT